VRDGFIGIHRDVSERGRALQELRDSQQQVREGRRSERILESIADAFYLLDDGWRFAYVNERAVHVLGGLLGRRMTRDDFLGQRGVGPVSGHPGDGYRVQLPRGDAPAARDRVRLPLPGHENVASPPRSDRAPLTACTAARQARTPMVSRPV
jgi:PAS domain-containing protein